MNPLLRAAIVVGVLGVLIVGGSVAAVLAAPPANLGAFDTGGRADLVAFRESLEATGYETRALAGSPLSLEDAVDPASTLVVVAGVERPYRASEIDALVDFVRRGGRLVLADDTGNANLVSHRFGVFFSAIPVYDPAYHGNVTLVAVNATLPGKEPYAPVVMNGPSSLSLDPSAEANGTVLASTSEDSFGDLDGNRIRDATDTKGPFVVAYRLEVGAGVVVFFADPDFLGTALVANRDLANAAFLQELVVQTLPNGVVVFDESRHGGDATGVVAKQALSLAVTALRDPFLGPVTFGLAVLVGLALVALVPAEPRLGHHASALDAATPVALEEPRKRLARAVRARLRSLHNLPPDADVARVTTDPVLAEIAASENGISPDKDLQDVVRRVRSYVASSPARRGPP